MTVQNIRIPTRGVESFEVDGTGLNSKVVINTRSLRAEGVEYLTLVCISPRPDPLISIFLMHLILLIWEIPAGLEFDAA